MISNYRFLNIFFSIKTMLILILSPVLLLIVNVSTIAAVECPEPKIKCIEEGGIEYFDNVSVVLDCWKYSVVYECKEESDNNCQELRDKGCSQVDARCKAMLNNSCVVQDVVYKCPIEKCDIAKNINCVKNLFCIGSNCEVKEEDKSECRARYIEKKCNEEVRPVCRVCEKNPHIVIREELYPGCQVRIHPTGKEECLIGTFGIGTHRKVVPRHLSSRVEVAGSRHGYFYVTVVNEITGKVLYNHARMNNGVAFDLTFSDTQDQTFRLVADRSDGCSCQWPGHLTMYIDRKYKSANVDWKEEDCRDI